VLYTLSFVIFVWTGFAWAFGWHTFRAALFPLALMLLMIPPPESALERVITWLQWGSAELTAWFFHLAMTPVAREGLVFDLPDFTIEVARECSGIRSSIALAITCLAAGYLFLRTKWTRTVFWLAILPMAIVKNGIRIATLSLLAVHVDPGFLFGRLHQYGGFLFFGIGLALLWCLLRVLQRMEQARSSSLPASN
jgi:exosortase